MMCPWPRPVEVGYIDGKLCLLDAKGRVVVEGIMLGDSSRAASDAADWLAKTVNNAPTPRLL